MKSDPLSPTRPRLGGLVGEDLNFLLTNRVPRLALTHLMGRVSRIRNRLLTRGLIRLWRQFDALDLSDAATQDFESLHACFTRQLRPGARPFDPHPSTLCSPCDAIVGACGTVQAGQLFQAKGMPYRLDELLGDAALASELEGCGFLTLRLSSAMYHRFHAPADCRIERVRYISGDTWNVNPITLQRIERLFCRNERAVIEARLAQHNTRMVLVPVAAILVASIRLHFADVRLHLRYPGPNDIPCAAELTRGQEMGWFEHGSTILMFMPPPWRLAPAVETGLRLRAGQALWRRG